MYVGSFVNNVLRLMVLLLEWVEFILVWGKDVLCLGRIEIGEYFVFFKFCVYLGCVVLVVKRWGFGLYLVLDKWVMDVCSLFWVF